MSFIEVFDKTMSRAVNRGGEFYQALIGVEDFVPDNPVVNSEDFNCGAVCNELEYARRVGDYYVQSLDVDVATAENLEAVINGFVNLARKNDAEADDIYRKRFKFLAVEKNNPRRTTKWAIMDAISYFLTDAATVQIIEPFSAQNLYFQVRIEGAASYEDALFLNSLVSGFLGQDFYGSMGIGAVVSYLGELLDRIKAAGVDFDILFIVQSRTTKTSSAIIGSVQLYKTTLSRVRGEVAITKTADATIV